MKKGRGFTAVMGCAVLVMSLAALGCGKTNSTVEDGTADAVALIDIEDVCTETCNTAISCIAEQFLADRGFALPATILDQDQADCMDMCTVPLGSDLQDEATRDCGLQCDLATDCGTYFDCLCGCGIEIYRGVCPSIM